ncbi:hypothetical protein FGIG_04852 [Fasciola gigantica]|uniref:Uncharacterized protein n=1 Tax=Fasciola gigantica TaxID=46835 RepID=A0A504YPH2_FASGI|nr:hypothetical protein FGIG_04852 [Fasciola gigantica]
MNLSFSTQWDIYNQAANLRLIIEPAFLNSLKAATKIGWSNGVHFNNVWVGLLSCRDFWQTGECHAGYLLKVLETSRYHRPCDTVCRPERALRLA